MNAKTTNLTMRGEKKMARQAQAPRVRVELSQETIDDGVQRDSAHCMFAEAVKAAHPGAASVSVDLQTIRFTDKTKGLRYTYLTPRICQAAIIQFDQGRKVSPFHFQLRGGQVTLAGSNKKRRLMRASERGKELTPAQLEQRREASNSPHAASTERVKASRLIRRDKGLVHDRVGGKTPPLQASVDDVPFTRRRAFGLRALEY